jgi:Resolvase, N terminal domain
MSAGRRARRAAPYVRVSTDQQTVTPELPLRQIAELRGYEVVEVYSAGVSGAKDRKRRPGLDGMLSDASRGKFVIVMAWAIDRRGRSLIDLLGTIQHGWLRLGNLRDLSSARASGAAARATRCFVRPCSGWRKRVFKTCSCGPWRKTRLDGFTREWAVSSWDLKRPSSESRCWKSAAAGVGLKRL